MGPGDFDSSADGSFVPFIPSGQPNALPLAHEPRADSREYHPPAPNPLNGVILPTELRIKQQGNTAALSASQLGRDCARPVLWHIMRLSE